MTSTPTRTRRNARDKNPDFAAEVARLTETYGRYLTYPDLAEYTGSSVRTLQRLEMAGELRVYRVGSARSYRIWAEDAAALMRPTIDAA